MSLFQVNRVKRFRNGNIRKNQDGSPMMENIPRDKGCIRPEFMDKHKLSPATTPDEYADIFYLLNLTLLMVVK